jgi:DNA helicase-2/ATP-dependent DNA helicase PcrA
VVFIVGCEDGYIPFKRDGHQLVDEDEERRLFYVAMTRAKEELYLSYAKKRRMYGDVKARKISPFIRDINESDKQYIWQQNRINTADTHKQLSLFE